MCFSFKYAIGPWTYQSSTTTTYPELFAYLKIVLGFHLVRVCFFFHSLSQSRFFFITVRLSYHCNNSSIVEMVRISSASPKVLSFFSDQEIIVRCWFYFLFIYFINELTKIVNAHLPYFLNVHAHLPCFLFIIYNNCYSISYCTKLYDKFEVYMARVKICWDFDHNHKLLIEINQIIYDYNHGKFSLFA
ncbi:putative guanosine nucleotide diphosphate dissociation inhibitor [Iris pallida]|uniref:Guanosine nucleotide diphosphate dissociation inhibitor n=1 Tax=Iris pallida TaxID=29817 RepID=A0AAX6IGQ6_IRIPA|nr:putative guanosine nucleotide diphosphate dissociation inhibitor [Iris pallida]